MAGITSKINKALSSLLGYDPVTKLGVHRNAALEKIGTDYGGWVIPENLLGASSVCYLAGAGEDLSFDTGIAEKYGCNVFIFDPTPKAIRHFETLKKNVASGIPTPVNNSSSLFYSISKEKFSLLHFYDYGIWDKEGVLKFFAPKNPEHASYSILNLQQTENYLEARVDRLSNIMKKLGHSSVDLLKLDIEGAEYGVLQSIVEDRPDIKMICVEYDEAMFPLDRHFLKRIKGSLLSLIKCGYLIVNADTSCNYTLVRKDFFRQMNINKID
jgi:FkbM family methyltransferase